MRFAKSVHPAIAFLCAHAMIYAAVVQSLGNGFATAGLAIMISSALRAAGKRLAPVRRGGRAER